MYLLDRELICELLHERIGADWKFPCHLKTWKSENKLNWLLSKIDPVVNEIFPLYPQTKLSPTVADEVYSGSMSFLRNMLDFFTFY
jgi:hypothetical protein